MNWKLLGFWLSLVDAVGCATAFFMNNHRTVSEYSYAWQPCLCMLMFLTVAGCVGLLISITSLAGGFDEDEATDED